jgi:hypothetical protein
VILGGLEGYIEPESFALENHIISRGSNFCRKNAEETVCVVCTGQIRAWHQIVINVDIRGIYFIDAIIGSAPHCSL